MECFLLYDASFQLERYDSARRCSRLFRSPAALEVFPHAWGHRTLSRYPKGSDNCLLPRHI